MSGKRRQATPIVLCLAHLGWEWVSERTRHMMARAAESFVVVVWEPAALLPDGCEPVLKILRLSEHLLVASPSIPEGLDADRSDAAMRTLLDHLLDLLDLEVVVAYHMTRLAVGFVGHLDAPVTVSDLVDERVDDLVGPSRMPRLERRLLRRADLVVTNDRVVSRRTRVGEDEGSQLFSLGSLETIRAARGRNLSPAWQDELPRPRIGYFGPIDTRLDLQLLASVAALRPAWHFIMVGQAEAGFEPVGTRPERTNLHWIDVAEPGLIPACVSGWDAGLLPLRTRLKPPAFAPGRALDLLAAGVPVVSTPAIQGSGRTVEGAPIHVRRDPEGIVAALEQAMAERGERWLARVDQRLSALNWAATWSVVQGLVDRLLKPGGITAANAGLRARRI